MAIFALLTAPAMIISVFALFTVVPMMFYVDHQERKAERARMAHCVYERPSAADIYESAMHQYWFDYAGLVMVHCMLEDCLTEGKGYYSPQAMDQFRNTLEKTDERLDELSRRYEKSA